MTAAAVGPSRRVADAQTRLCELVDPTIGRSAWPVYAAIYAGSVYVGRHVTTDVSGIGVAWPAVGVGLLWLYPYLLRDRWWARRDVWWVLAWQVLSTMAVNWATNLHEPSLWWPSGLNNALVVLVTGLAYLRGGPEREPGLTSGHEVRRLAAACAVGIAVGYVTLPVSGMAAGKMTWQGSLFWLLRNGTILLYGGVGTLLLFGRRSPVPLPRVGWLAVIGAFLPTAVIMTSLGRLDGPPVGGYLIILLTVGSAAFFSVVETYVFLTGIGCLLTVLAAGTTSPLTAGRIDRDQQASLVYAVMLIVLLVAMTTVVDRQDRADLVAQVRAERAEAQDLARASVAQAELVGAIVSSMTDGVLLLGADDSVRLHNDSAMRLLDAGPTTGGAPDAAEPSGATGVEGVEGAGGTTFHGIAAAARESLSAGPTDALVDGRDGAPVRTVAVQAAPLRASGDGELAVVLRDVTDDRRRLDELRTFARVLAHDLRQPLTSVGIWTDMLQEDLRPGSEEAEAADHVRRGILRMEAFLNDLTGYTLARDGRLEPDVVDVGDLAQEVVEVALASRPDEPAPSVTIRAPHRVVADRALLRQVIDNLVANSFKYVDVGRAPRVDIHTATEPGWVRLIVDDAGVGIPDGEHAAVFDEFHRAAAHRAAFEGTGLGLAVCRRIAERHGGRISAGRSPLGGARIEVRLPS